MLLADNWLYIIPFLQLLWVLSRTDINICQLANLTSQLTFSQPLLQDSLHRPVCSSLRPLISEQLSALHCNRCRSFGMYFVLLPSTPVTRSNAAWNRAFQHEVQTTEIQPRRNQKLSSKRLEKGLAVTIRLPPPLRLVLYSFYTLSSHIAIL